MLRREDVMVIQAFAKRGLDRCDIAKGRVRLIV